MTALTLVQGDAIADAAIVAATAHGFAAVCIVVLDAGGTVLVTKRQEAAAPYRVDIAQAKAAGCIGMGLGGRGIAARAAKVPAFYAAVNAFRPLLPVPGGVLIRADDGTLLGAVGVSGDTADNDEICAIAGIEAVGLVAEA